MPDKENQVAGAVDQSPKADVSEITIVADKLKELRDAGMIGPAQGFELASPFSRHKPSNPDARRTNGPARRSRYR